MSESGAARADVTARPWRIATRRSQLAQTQAREVGDALQAVTGRPVELVPMATSGDEHPDRAVEAFDTKGLFVDRTREAVRSGDCDVVVHSYKDLPTEAAPGLVVGAVPERVDPRDLLVTRDGHRLVGLPRDATVGTSSVRRRAQLQHARRDLLVQPLRGNLDTRLRKVADGHLDAAVVALAGVLRLGGAGDLPLQAAPLEHGECLHSPAQGALAVECRADDDGTRETLAAIEHADTRACVDAERWLLADLEGGCSAPIGAHASLVDGDGSRLELLGMLSDLGGTRLLRASHQGAADQPELLGRTLGDTLRSQGGGAILERLRAAH